MLKYEIAHLGLLSKDCVLCCLNTYFFKSFYIDLFQYKTVSEENKKKKNSNQRLQGYTGIIKRISER